MKKRYSIFIPILALAFLVNCNKGGDTPVPSATYTVTFDSRSGSYTPENQIVEVGKQASEPINPTKDDFTFGGWYTDEAATEYQYDFSRPVVSDLTLYAKWTPIDNLVTVTFDAGDGTFANGEHTFPIKVDRNSELNLCLNIIHSYGEPTLEGNTFAYYDYKDTDKGIGYNDIVTDDVTIAANYFPTKDVPYKDLNDISWEVIKKVATNVSSGVIESVFDIGATKVINLKAEDGKTEVKHTVQILDSHSDYLHYDKTPTKSSAKFAGITFDFRTVISGSNKKAITTKWDSSSNKKFTESTLNNLLNNNGNCIFNRLPDDLKPLIENVDKHVGEYGSSFQAKKYTAKLFPLAHNEMDQNAEGVTKDEGSIYEYYEDGDTSVRIKKDSSGNKSVYWLRSPYTKSDMYGEFNKSWAIEKTGVPYTSDFDNELAFAPAFCI